MTTRVVKTALDRKLLLRFIEAQALPFTINIAKGAKRTVDQNRLQRLWMKEAAEQLDGYTAEQHRGHCKLHFGVPILREENEAFREAYDRVIKPLLYEHKLACMQEPFDFGVTRLMTVKQKSLYLDMVSRHFLGLGVLLTQPEDRQREAA